jgi:hypothetical protein
MLKRLEREKARPWKRNLAGRVEALLLLALALALVSSCGGGGSAAPPVRTALENPVSNPVAPRIRKGHVHISLSEVGDDIEITGPVVSPRLEKALTDAGIKLVPSSDEAQVILHGTVRLRLQQTNSRLGLDHHTYGAQADWQLLAGDGYRSLLSRSTVAEGAGTGKVEAITNTLAELAGKVAAEAVPFIQSELAKR